MFFSIFWQQSLIDPDLSLYLNIVKYIIAHALCPRGGHALLICGHTFVNSAFQKGMSRSFKKKVKAYWDSLKRFSDYRWFNLPTLPYKKRSKFRRLESQGERYHFPSWPLNLYGAQPLKLNHVWRAEMRIRITGLPEPELPRAGLLLGGAGAYFCQAPLLLSYMLFLREPKIILTLNYI